MSYIINNSRGQIVAVIPDGVVNTSATNLALVGQAVLNYGTYQNENYLYLLENFAKGTAPTTPVLGQLWYNANTDVMSAYNSASTWTPLASQSYVSASISASFINPAFSGVPTAPTADPGTSTTQLATTAFVNQTISNFSGSINNATLTGNSTAVTAANGTATTQIATTAYVINQLQGSGPIVTTGNISAGNISTNGTITAGNILNNGTISSTGNIYAPNFIGNLVGNVSGAATISGGTLTVDTVIANNVVSTGTSAFRLPNLTQTQINGLAAQNGDMVYNTTTSLAQVYQNGSWKNFTLSYYS